MQISYVLNFDMKVAAACMLTAEHLVVVENIIVFP
jgi:hypothetical protein